MAISDFRPKGDIWTGVAIGVGLLLAPVVIPVVAAAVRPIAKAAFKYSLVAYERGREVVAEMAEAVEDLAAEAKAEVEAELQAIKNEEV
jgi:hypothetical protein